MIKFIKSTRRFKWSWKFSAVPCFVLHSSFLSFKPHEIAAQSRSIFQENSSIFCITIIADLGFEQSSSGKSMQEINESHASLCQNIQIHGQIWPCKFSESIKVQNERKFEKKIEISSLPLQFKSIVEANFCLFE